MGRLILGDCREVLPALDAESIDACVTDPPYHLTSINERYATADSMATEHPVYKRHTRGFMGKGWDGGDVAFDPATWAAVLRVLKPGAHLLAFGGTRTYHRLVCAVEDAGFEIRDTITWLYGSGFPKSLDVSKAIDKTAGHWRGRAGAVVSENGAMAGPNFKRSDKGDAVTAAAAAAGYGTALKPACELIVLARKPLSESSVGANFTRHRTGALNIDACRIHTPGSEAQPYTVTRLKPGATLNRTGGNWRPEDGGVDYHGQTKAGRWPANVVFDESAAAMLDEASGERPSGYAHVLRRGGTTGAGMGYGSSAAGNVLDATYGDTGGASRFFYTAKADGAERNVNQAQRNSHPTVKPVSLMSWLVRLVTPSGGVVLDPFLGSGTTAIACIGNGLDWIGIEREIEYCLIAQQRIGLGCEVVEHGELAGGLER